MENASKALLIAGSVLIAIVLIAVGIKILNSTSGITEQVNQVSTSMEVSMFNSQFAQYEGKQKGSAVNTLIRLVEQNNKKNASRQISLTKPGSIVVGTSYTVEITGTDDEGYVNAITITPPTT